MPFFVVKKREARLAVRYLKYKSTRGQLRHTPGAEQGRNELYKRLLEQCRAERKADAWRRAA